MSGTAVFSGMLGVTNFGLLFKPMFYVVVARLIERGANPAQEKDAVDVR